MFLLKLIQLTYSLVVVPLTNNKLKNSIWQHGPEWLTTQHYPEQTHIHVATNELVIKINPVNPVPPVLDLERISSYTRAINIMSKS